LPLNFVKRRPGTGLSQAAVPCPPMLSGPVVSSFWPRVVVLILIAGWYFTLPNARPDLTAFNADDSEAYLALSYALTHGLGYTRSLAAGFYVPHTTWPPGMPILLAPVMLLTTLPISLLAIKITAIVIGLCGILLAWLYVVRVTRSLPSADLAALILSLQPFYWLFSRMALTEVPTIAVALLALLLVDLVWAERHPSAWQAVAVGLVAGLGMLLRGTLAGLIFVPLAYAVGPRRTRTTPTRGLALWAIYAAGFCVAFAAWSARNRTIDPHGLGFDAINQTRMLIAMNPVDPASPLMTPVAILRSFTDNLVHRIIYNVPEQVLPGLWVAHWRNWTGAPYLAVILAASLAVVAFPRRAAALPLFVTLLPYCLLMFIYALGGSIRYWVPITGLLSVLIVIGLAPAWSGLRPAVRHALSGMIIAAYGANLAIFVKDFETKPYMGDLGDMVTLFEQTRALRGQPVLMLTPHGALFSLETGIPAPMTVSARNVEPQYTHLIKHNRSAEYSDQISVPHEAIEIDAVGAWHLYALPAPMTVMQIDAENTSPPRHDSRQ
jgi:4-amino-4-deoxy-L-arabinose transferase-like glycosyltransferase